MREWRTGAQENVRAVVHSTSTSCYELHMYRCSYVVRVRASRVLLAHVFSR